MDLSDPVRHHLHYRKAEDAAKHDSRMQAATCLPRTVAAQADGR
ncbi:MAG TPA: hypothetical protein VIX82_14185 [Solirubrobacteraceae bacterium]